MTDTELDDIQKEFERLRVKYAPLIEDDLETVQQERARRAKRQRKPVPNRPISN